MYSSLHWLNDLTVSLCYLLGQICSSLLITRPRPISKEGKPRPVEEQRRDELLVNSDLWKTLFRGGYMTGKLTRSLSGAYVRREQWRSVGADLLSLSLFSLSVSLFSSPSSYSPFPLLPFFYHPLFFSLSILLFLVPPFFSFSSRFILHSLLFSSPLSSPLSPLSSSPPLPLPLLSFSPLFHLSLPSSPLFLSPSLPPQSAKPADDKLSAVLNDLASNRPEGPGVKLVEMCRGQLKGQYYGGTLVDTAVNTVFAALIWNSQECREELGSFGKGLTTP